MAWRCNLRRSQAFVTSTIRFIRSSGLSRGGAVDSSDWLDAFGAMIFSLHKVAECQGAGRFFAVLDAFSETGCKEHPPHGPPCLDCGLHPNGAQKCVVSFPLVPF